MKKRFLAIAIAAGMAAPLAVNANTTVYGQVQAEIASWGSDADGMSVEDNARGRLGVKASEDLGNGMTGLAKAEFKIDTADGDSTSVACALNDTNGDTPANVADDTVSCTGGGIALTKREMWVGLKAGWGTIELGRLKSAYKYYGGVTYDPYVTSVLEARNNGGMSGSVGVGNGYGHNGFISDSLGYSYKMGAMSFRLTYDFDDGGAAGTTNATGNNGMTFGFKYKTKMYEVIFSMANDDNGAAEVSATKLGGKVNMGGAGILTLQFEQGEASNVDGDVMYVDYQFPLTKNDMLDVAYGSSDDDAATDSTDFMRLAVKHKLSKQTSAWFGYRSTEEGAAEVSVIAVGMRKDF